MTKVEIRSSDPKFYVLSSILWRFQKFPINHMYPKGLSVYLQKVNYYKLKKKT